MTTKSTEGPLVAAERRRRALPPRLITPEQMTERVDPDTQVALAGGMGMHLPCEAARQLVARGEPVRVMTSAAGIATDIMLRGGVVAELQFAFVSLDELGLSPAFRQRVAEGSVALVEMESAVMLAGLRAAMSGLPWMPHPDLGNSIRTLTPSLFEDADPGPGLRAVRAIRPDVAYLQAAYCDSAGNLYYRDTSIMDFMFAAASTYVVATVEEQRPDDEVVPTEAKVPGYLVDDLVVGRGLGAPGAVPGYYASDHETIRREALAPRGAAGKEAV